MILLNINPFRILGTLSNASLKELKSSEVTIKRYLDVGKSPVLKFDITPPMEPIERSLEDIVKAKNQIHNPKDKLIHSIFWFISSSTIDNIALSKLTESKNTVEALETFRKGSKDFTVSEKTSTCILNHTSLELLLFTSHKDETRFFDALKKKIEILSDKSIVRHFEFLVTGEKDKVEYIDVKDGVFEYVKDILIDVFPNRSQTKLLLSILPSNSNFKQEIEEGLVSDVIKRISVENNKFDDIFKANKADKSSKLKKVNKTQTNKILEAGRNLVEVTKSSFKELNKYIDKSDYQFENILNEVFSRANAAIIYLYNAELNYIKNTSGNYDILDYSIYIKDLTNYENILQDYSCDIKSTISKNNRSIKEEAEGSNCWFCQTNKSRDRSSYRIQMYKRDYLSNSYSFFKNGGVPVERCSKCSHAHFYQKTLAFLCTLCIYAAIAATVIGIFFIFGDMQNGFWLFTKILRWFTNQFDFIARNQRGCGSKQLESNEMISQYLLQGYSFDKPT